MAESVVRSRIDPVVKMEAERVLRSMGITLSDGICLFLFQVIAVMAAARKSKVDLTTDLRTLRKSWKHAACGK